MNLFPNATVCPPFPWMQSLSNTLVSLYQRRHRRRNKCMQECIADCEHMSRHRSQSVDRQRAMVAEGGARKCVTASNACAALSCTPAVLSLACLPLSSLPSISRLFLSLLISTLAINRLRSSRSAAMDKKQQSKRDTHSLMF